VRETRDAVIVGGGPAGLVAAIAARRVGLAVTLVEPRRPPIDKACGEGLMPSALAALVELGIDLGALGRPFRGIRYVADERVAEADFPSGALGRGVRRVELHGALVEAARSRDVELLFGRRATALAEHGVELEGGERLAARFVIGADGLRSAVRRWSGLERRGGGARRFGVRRHYALEPWSERVEVVFGDRAEAYVTPLGAREIGIALLWQGAARGFDDLLARRLPRWLGERLAGARVTSRDRGAGPFRQRARRAARGAVALVGDAAGYVDALTGEGMAIAFEEALALAPALANGDLTGYARRSARLRRLPEGVTRLALLLSRHHGLRRRAVGALARDPELFSRLLGVLGARRPLASLDGAAVARFGLRLLAPAGATER